MYPDGRHASIIDRGQGYAKGDEEVERQRERERAREGGRERERLASLPPQTPHLPQAIGREPSRLEPNETYDHDPERCTNPRQHDVYSLVPCNKATTRVFRANGSGSRGNNNNNNNNKSVSIRHFHRCLQILTEILQARVLT